MTNIYLLIAALFLLAGYGVVANRMLAFGRRFREDAVETGMSLLEDQQVPVEVKEVVRNILPDATSVGLAWCFAASVVPVTIKYFVRNTTRNKSTWVPAPSAPYWKKWDTFNLAMMFAVLCNSPMAAFLFIIQMLIVSFLAVPNILIARLLRSVSHHHEDGWFQHA